MGALVASVVLALVLGVALGSRRRGAHCDSGFTGRSGRCVIPPGACPLPLVSTSRGCDAPDERIPIPTTTLLVGSADWEAEGRVSPRTVSVAAFAIDAFEVTRGRWSGSTEALDGDLARAASGMTRAEAEAFCVSAGGRLPTEDEWMAAAVAGGSNAGRRYPWGDTGAVCRRAAWGLATGPCAEGTDGPDTVGAHRAGDSALGVHDMAGNVAEWVSDADVAGQGSSGAGGIGVAKGGSWRTALASELRVWSRLDLPVGARDERVGVRCAYPP